MALRGDQRHAAERDQYAGPLREADALAERRGEQQDEDRRDRKVQDAARRRGVVQAEPLQREVRAAAGEAERRENHPVSFFQQLELCRQTVPRERRENHQNQDQAPDGGERRADLVARRARDDPVAGPQQQRREEDEPGSETHAQAIIACVLSSIMPRVTAAGRSLEYEWVGTGRSGRPVLVFLHEGLGSIRQWRDFPQDVAQALGCRALVYDRYGYGQSDVLQEPRRSVRFMHDEALFSLPEVLSCLKVENPV